MNSDNIFENANTIVLKEQKVGKILSVNIIKTITTKYGSSFLLYNSKNNVLFFPNSQLKSYLSKAITNLKFTNGYYYKDDNKSSILDFEISKISIEDTKIRVDLNLDRKSVV